MPNTSLKPLINGSKILFFIQLPIPLIADSIPSRPPFQMSFPISYISVNTKEAAAPNAVPRRLKKLLAIPAKSMPEIASFKFCHNPFAISDQSIPAIHS